MCSKTIAKLNIVVKPTSLAKTAFVLHEVKLRCKRHSSDTHRISFEQVDGSPIIELTDGDAPADVKFFVQIATASINHLRHASESERDRHAPDYSHTVEDALRKSHTVRHSMFYVRILMSGTVREAAKYNVRVKVVVDKTRTADYAHVVNPYILRRHSIPAGQSRLIARQR